MAAPMLGRYALLGKLASGGMSDLHLATTQGPGGFERLQVIKRVRPHLLGPDLAAMLLDEARIAAALRHSNIVQVLDVGIEGGEVFLAMEYLHGKDVGLVQRAAGQLPLDHALAIVIGVCAGLDHAHEKRGPDGRSLGIVHRDVSPSNVIVTFDGHVKVIDFGIAKATNRMGKTEFGTFKGKLGYASPEQCRCEPLDRRSDVYSIGVLLYELTCGRRPFDDENEFALLRKVTEEDAPPPRTLVRDYPPALERIVLGALARDREGRCRSAGELQAELEAFARTEGLSLAPTRLARFMARLFPAEVQRWDEMAGDPALLAEHVLATWSTTVPDRPAARTRRSRRLWRVAIPAALAAALAGGGGYLLGDRGRSEDAAAGGAGDAAPHSTAQAAPATAPVAPETPAAATPITRPPEAREAQAAGQAAKRTSRSHTEPRRPTDRRRTERAPRVPTPAKAAAAPPASRPTGDLDAPLPR